MADGGWRGSDEIPTLGQLAGGAMLWARCGCGEEASLDPAPWICQGLASHPVSQLGERLRCRCGARQVSLEVRGPAEPARTPTGGIFIFR